jgi:putative addiction module component (TIGR02574 family)
MAVTAKSLGIDHLKIEEKLALVEEIWASICADRTNFALTEAQRVELDRRVADDDAFPDDVIPWEEIKALVRAQRSK